MPSFYFFKEVFINTKNVRINNQIRAREVRLIGENGESFGIVSIEEALRKAEEAELDLVEIAPNANPPVVRIMDFGKYMYEMTKKEKTAKKKQHQTEIKEIHFRPSIFEHDLDIKINQARKFFEKKNKVRFVVMFRGREMQHFNDGLKILEKVKEKISDIAVEDSEPKIEGRRIFQIFSFSKDGSKKKKKEEEQNAKVENEKNRSEEI
ncbi:MAG: translation initiation factor IF-3 [candidate division WOR-3 bacterium]